ncbi:hypothetical protein NDU88_003368 [Pleurodeles waltl]|uniref:Uncharacterized protein n=1 Tax=Pleurodeles waltl TaxID=8319 RepID=A0AAV7TPL4_PLEWA|nr:hypothetical protein NDU88_003368 [Pleurodeles waltl]
MATSGTKDLPNMLLKPKGLDKEIEKELKPSDWAKDSGDKFYSLTEESDLSSREHSCSESGSSVSSETGNISSSNEPTVRQLRRQRKCTKIRSGPQEGTEFSTSIGSKTLKWDYSGFRLTDTTTTSGQQLLNNNMEECTGGPTSSACMVDANSGMLQSIYNSIKELQTETRIENRSARVATKCLQGTVCKVAKSCTEIEAKLMDERIAAVEEDADALKQQSATRDGQLTDVMWKLEDFENRQRRNNLRFLCIDEGLEGSDIRAYMIKLLPMEPRLEHRCMAQKSRKPDPQTCLCKTNQDWSAVFYKNVNGWLTWTTQEHPKTLLVKQINLSMAMRAEDTT